jgi:type VI secretion system protein ImpA
LVETFWDDGLFPSADVEDMEDRLAAIAGLNGQESNGTLMQPLRKITLFEMAGEPVRFWQFEQAEEAASITDAARRNQRLATGVLPLADLEAEARGAGRVALGRVGQDLVQAMAAWTALDTALTGKAGNAAPSTRRVADLLARQRRIIERYAGAIEIPDAGDPDEVAAIVSETSLEAGHQPTGYDREALLGEIARIARLFRINEPNAPLSYTLDDAVRRARLAWPELLREMMPEMAPRAALLTSLGIRHQPD